jgi:peptidoglycan/LPS O-acetylase OafA/YrhL
MSKKIYSLQSMRLFASLMVFQYHLWNNYLNRGFVHPGTDFFIVLVGFVAAVVHSHRIPNGKWGKYLGRRYLRLYVTFIPIFVLYVLAGRDSYNLEYFVKSFFFIPISDRLPLVGPTWMLSLFLLFYCLFSIAFIFRSERVLIPVFALWGIAILAHSWYQWNPGLPPEWANTLFNYRNIEFIFGYLGGKMLVKNQIRSDAGRWIMTIGAISLIPMVILLNTDMVNLALRSFLVGIPTTLLVLGLGILEINNSTNRVLQILIHPWLVWLGGTSYVLYLVHNMVLRIWDTFIPITIIQIPIITIIVIGVSALGYIFWEKPMLKYLQNKLSGTDHLRNQDIAFRQNTG